MSVPEENLIGPREEAKKYINLDKDKDGFTVKFINKNIGKGVFAAKQFKAGEFLLEYVGDLVSHKEILNRERTYSSTLGSYLYFITWKGKRFGVDATFSDRICRFANDGTGVWRNSVMTLETFNNRPHLCLYASKDIHIGDEIRYDYGVHNLPWRQKMKVGDLVHNQGQKQKTRKSHNSDQYDTDKDSITKYVSSGNNPYILRSHRKKHRRHYSRFRKLIVCSPDKSRPCTESPQSCSAHMPDDNPSKQISFVGKRSGSNKQNNSYKIQITQKPNATCQQSGQHKSRRKPKDVCKKLQCTSKGAAAIVSPCSVIIERLTLQGRKKRQIETIPLHEASAVKSCDPNVDVPDQNFHDDVQSNSLQEIVTAGNVQGQQQKTRKSHNSHQYDTGKDSITKYVSSGNNPYILRSHRKKHRRHYSRFRKLIVCSPAKSRPCTESPQSCSAHVPDDNPSKQKSFVGKRSGSNKQNNSYKIQITQKPNATCQQSGQQKSRRKPKDLCKKLQCTSKGAAAIVSPCSVIIERLTLQGRKKRQIDTIPLHEASAVKLCDPNQNVQDDVQSNSFQESVTVGNVQVDVPSSNIQEDVPSYNIPEDIHSGGTQKDLPSYIIQEDTHSGDIQEDVPSYIIHEDIHSGDIQKDVPSNIIQEDIHSGDIGDIQEDVQSGSIQVDVQTGNIQEDVQSYDIQQDARSGNTQKDVKSDNIQGDVQSSNIQEVVPSYNIQEDIHSGGIQKDVPSYIIQEDTHSGDIQEDVPSYIIQEDFHSVDIRKDVPSYNLQGDFHLGDDQKDVPSFNMQEDIHSVDIQKDVPSYRYIIQEDTHSGDIQEDVPSYIIQEDFHSVDIRKDVPSYNMQGDFHLGDDQKDVPSFNMQEDIHSVDIQKDVPLYRYIIQEDTHSGDIQEDVQSGSIQVDVQSYDIQQDAMSGNIQEDLTSDNIQDDVQSGNIQEVVPSYNIKKDIHSGDIQKDVPSYIIQEDTHSGDIQEDVPSYNIQEDIHSGNIRTDVTPNNTQEVEKDVQSRNIQQNVQFSNIEEDVPPDNIEKVVPSNNIEEDVPSCNIHIDVQSCNSQVDVASDNIQEDARSDNIQDDLMSKYKIKIRQLSNATCQQPEHQECRKLQCTNKGASAIVTPCSVMIKRLTLQSLIKYQIYTIPIHGASTVKYSDFRINVPDVNIHESATSGNLQRDISSDNNHCLTLCLPGCSQRVHHDRTRHILQDDVPLKNIQADVLKDNLQDDLQSENQKYVPSNEQREDVPSSNSIEVLPPANRKEDFQSDDLLIVEPTTNLQHDELRNNSQDALSEKPQEDVQLANLQNDTSSDKHKKSIPKLNNQNTTRKGSSVRKAKPYRPCLFCGKLQSKLALHIRRRHAQEERVKRALLLPNILRDREFDKMRKDGIFAANSKILLDKNLKESDKRCKLLIERRQGNKNVSICSVCNGFYATNTIYKHKYNCPGTAASTTEPTALPISTIGEEKDPEDFRDNILAKFRRDQVGDICRRDALIKLLGQQNFNRVKTRTEKKVELTDTIMRDMRRFATLFVEFKSLAEKKDILVSSSIDILKREHFTHLKDAIVNLTTKEDGTIKSGLKIGLGFLIKKAVKVLKGHYLMQQKDDEAAEVENFSTLLTYFWTSMFSDAEYANVKARQLDLRRPKHLPIEEDIQKLRNYTLNKIDELLNPHCLFTGSEYISLRDLIVCRLTLFNARRGGEPSRLLIQEWKDAENDEWINDASVQSIDDPIEKQLIGKFKIAFQSGKNLNQLVPLLIPNDCLKGIRKLANLEVRQNAGVDKKNIFLFPNTKNSEKHIKGWHAVRNVCIEANLPKHITATSMRHRAATAYATLDVPENERQIFYRHMGHSEDMNRNVYQCPMAIQEVTKVGKFLETLDSENHFSSPTSARRPVDSQERSVCDDVHSADDRGNSDNCQAYDSYSKDSDDSEFDDRNIAEDIDYNASSSKKDTCPASIVSARIPIETQNQCMVSSIDSNSSGPSGTKSRKLSRGLQGNMNMVSTTDTCSAEPTRRKSKKHGRELPENLQLSNDSHSSDDGDYSEIDKDYSPNSEESSDMDSDDGYNANEILQSASSRRTGKRISWSTEDTSIIREYFSTWVDDTSTLDRKGSLPGKTIITAFLTKYPKILRNWNMKKRVSLMRTKLYNERNKTRSKLTTYLSPMFK